MINSQYNYFIPYKGKLLIFNGLTRRWIVLPTKDEQDAIEKILNNPDAFFENGNNNKLFQLLHNGGFIVLNRKIEKQKVLDATNKKNNARHGHLCILTTYECNLRCWYCVQKHSGEQMSIGTQEKTKNFIKRFIEEEHLKSLHISFFGGEPLMNPDAIANISTYAKKMCKKHAIPFHNSITTNGTLIDNDLIEMFKEVELTDFQITIDGTRDYHNKVKKSKYIIDTYRIVCSNITQLLTKMPNCDVTIRYNYTAKNLSLAVADDLIDSFDEKLRKNLEFLPRQVWQEDDSRIDENLLKELIDIIQQNGFKVNKTVDMDYAQCYAESKYFFNIFHNGKIDKCGNISPNKAIGEILSDGRVSWKKSLSTVYEHLANLSPPCLNCKYFPICFGPCLIRRRSASETKQPLRCLYSNPDKYFEQVILHYVESFE